MKSTVKLPRVAETVDEVVVSEIAVTAGDAVAVGDVLMRVETDKALVEVPCPIAGVVTEILVGIDDEIATGMPIVTLETS